jgi:hypothetical protein
MIAKLGFGLALGSCIIAIPAMAQSPGPLTVHVDHFVPNGMIPIKYAACVPKAPGHMGFGPDINPAISWSAGPPGTQSYAIFLEDTDSPAEHRDWMNKEGETLTAKLKRQTFFHWVLIDVSSNVTSIAEGAVSNGLVPHGKPQIASPVGVPGINNYTAVFAKNAAMNGTYYGYDGPCPPWNDDVVHHYHFRVYALGVPKLNVPANFDGSTAIAAMQGKVLAKGQEVGLYTTNLEKGAKVPSG